MASLVWRKDRRKWYTYFTDGNGRHLGKPLEKTAREENLSKRERLHAMAEAEDIAADYAGVPLEKIDLETAAAMWLDDCRAQVRFRTWERYRGVTQRFLDHVTGDKRIPLADVSEIDIRSFRDWRLTNRQKSTVRNDLKCLHTMFAWFRRQRDPRTGERWIAENPAEDIHVGSVVMKAKRFPADDEIRKMLELLLNESREMQALGLFGALAGMRRMEIIMLRTENIDLAAGILYVWGKSKRPRPVPMHSQIKNWLMDGALDGEFLLRSDRPTRGGEHWSHALGRNFNAWLKAHGFPWTHKALRHWWINSLRQHAELSVEARLLISGHEDEETNRVYHNPRSEEARPAVESLLSL